MHKDQVKAICILLVYHSSKKYYLILEVFLVQYMLICEVFMVPWE